MRLGLHLARIALLLSLALPGFAQRPSPAPPDTKEADKLLNRALRLQSDPTAENLTQAVEALHAAADIDPTDPAIATAKEAAKTQLATQHIETGNRLMLEGRTLEAQSEFRSALLLDPTNAYAAQRLHDATPPEAIAPARQALSTEFAAEPALDPKTGSQNITFKGDTRGLFQTIGQAFGITFVFDDSFQPRQVRFKLENVDFFRALNIAERMSRAFSVPLDRNRLLIAADNAENRKKLERMSMRIFRLPTAAGPQELTDVLNLFRVMLDVRFATINAGAGTITVRARKESLDAAERLISDMSEVRPQVMLDVHILQVDHSAMRNIGLNLPLQFTIFNINTEARTLLQGGAGLTGILAQLASGANLSANDLAAAAALLAAQQGGNGSPLLKPFATFGGGITRQGVTIPAPALNLQFNNSWFKSLQQVTLRAEQGNAALLHVGDRFPVLTQSFSQATRSFTGRAVQQQPIIPAFTYEDLGVTLKATPQVTGRGDVTLALELQIKALGGESFNGVPTIANREYKGSITVKDGETTAMTGYMSSTEQKAVSGLPLLSRVPGLRLATSNNFKESTTSELLVIITPHVVSSRDQRAGSEIYFAGR